MNTQSLMPKNYTTLPYAQVSRSDRAKSDLQWHASALRNRLQRVTERRRARISELGARLNALSPLATLQRGYAVARGPDGHALTSATLFHVDMRFNLVLKDGEVAAQVTHAERAS